MIRIIKRCMTDSKLTEKKWDGHFAFFHLKEFSKYKQVYLNGKPLKWYNRFKNGDIVEVIESPKYLTMAYIIGTAVSTALASTMGVTISFAAAMIVGGIIAGLGIAGVGLALTKLLGNSGGGAATTQNKEYSSTTQPELRGASNDISDDIVPVVFGEVQQTPSYAQTPYRLVADGSGENKYRQYFIANYNNVSYSNFKLGETPIDNYISSYYDIVQATGSNNFIGYENVKAISVDEELSYDKTGEVTQSVVEDINQSVTALSVAVNFSLKFENVPSSLSNFSNKTFNVEVIGENNRNSVDVTSNTITITKSNITQSGSYYTYSGSLSVSASLTTLTSVTFAPVDNTRNNKQETNSQLNVSLTSMTVTAGIYSHTFTENKPVNKYLGIPSEVIQSSPPNTTEIDVILSFQQGLYKINSQTGSRKKRTSTVEIMYKTIDETTWHSISDASAIYIRDINGVKQPLSSSTTKVNGANVTVESPSDINLADQLFFRSIGIEVPEGQYNVRVRSAEYSDKTNYDIGVANCAEVQFRCTGNVVNPIILPNVKQLAMEIKAYKGLSGTLKKFNYFASVSIPIWNGTDWNTKAVSSNPAAIVRYLLTDPLVNPRAESVDHLDNDSLVEYYEWCEESGYKADGIVAEAVKIGEVVNEILQNSQCAMIPLYNGKHTFVIDKPNKTPVGMFNQHNSWDFNWSPSVGRQTEAIRASFVENDDWTQDELTLYWYNGACHDEPEEGKTDSDYQLIKKEYKYVFDRDSVRKIVEYELTVTQTKRNQFEFSVNLEAINMMLLDRVYISNTTNMQGEQTGLIKKPIVADGNLTGFELYSDIEIPSNAKIIIRSLDYVNEKPVINIYDVVNSGYTNKVMIDSTPYDGIVKGAGEITGIKDRWHYDGDLFTLGQDTVYDCIVTDIKYNEDGTATITARDY